MTKCSKCKQNLSEENYETKSSGDLYSTCKKCRPLNNLQSKQSYSRKNKFICEECKKEYSTNGSLKSHLWGVHNIGNGTLFECTEDVCEFTCKSNGDLKRHLSNVHDIGPNRCDYCNKNRFKLNSYTDRNAGNVSICRNCYKKETGYTNRVEKQMVEYLEKTEIKEYIIQKDKIVKGNICDTKRRPDLLIGSTDDCIIDIECDEDQHRGYNPECEIGRMNEIMDEMSDLALSFIRWNPDYYEFNGKRGNKSRQQRLELLLKLVRKVSRKKSDTVTVYYMFYSKDNPVITKELNVKMIYDENDILNC